MFQWEFDILHFASFFTASVCVCVGGWRDRAPTSFISALLSPSLPVLIREPARQVLRRQVLRLTWSKWVGEPDYLGDTGQVWGKKWEIWGATELLEGLHLWHPLSKERIGRSWAEKTNRFRLIDNIVFAFWETKEKGPEAWVTDIALGIFCLKKIC